MEVSPSLRRVSLIVWVTLGCLLLGGVIVWLMSQVRVIWLPLAFSFGLTVILDPVARAFQRVTRFRVLAIVFAFLTLALVLTGVGSILFPLINQQVTEFGETLPDLYTRALSWVIDTGSRFGVDVETDLTAEGIQKWLSDPANQETIAGFLGGFGTGAGRLLRGVAEVVSVVLLSPIFAFYMLVDLDRTKRLLIELTPPRLRDEVRFVGSNLGAALGSFVRGQLLVAFLVGLLSSVMLRALDVPFWLIIGIVSGLLNMVPFVGPLFGAALGVLSALLDFRPFTALIVAGLFLVIQQIDNHLITPLVQRARVRLSPLIIVLSLLAGGTLAGLLGVLVAVPAVAAVRIVFGHLWRTRVLGESWQEASSAMIEMSVPPERLVRRKGEQTRLFDTAEMAALPPEPEKSDV